jgi:SAM-dependent methyltransferase
MMEDEMAQTALRDPAYVMGRSEAESRRLMLQAQLYDRITRRFLEDAGLASGMTVLDVGSGAGDVTFAAADLVGSRGRVVGVDVNPVVLEVARTRAHNAGRHNVTFVAGDCRTALVGDGFDAAIGRLVLMYTRDVTETVRAMADRVKPGGIVAFAEGDFTPVLGYVDAGPPSLSRSHWHWGADAFACGGIHVSMASPVNQAFVAAGLGEPEMVVHTPVGGGDAWPGYEWFAASLCSLLPIMEQHGIATAAELDPDSLAERLRAEVVATGVPLMLIPLLTAWARKPLDG